MWSDFEYAQFHLKNGIKFLCDSWVSFPFSLHDLPSDYEAYPGTLQALNVKLRNAVIRVFNTTLDAMDNRAEKLAANQQDKDWDFMDYFLCMVRLFWFFLANRRLCFCFHFPCLNFIASWCFNCSLDKVCHYLSLTSLTTTGISFKLTL